MILEGAAVVAIDAATCSQVQYACALLSEGSGASFRDAISSDASNVACALVTNRLTCFPGWLKYHDKGLFKLSKLGSPGTIFNSYIELTCLYKCCEKGNNRWFIMYCRNGFLGEVGNRIFTA